MKLRVTLEGRDAEVGFQADGGGLRLEVEGRTLEADFQRLPDGEVYSLLVDGRSYEVRVAPAGRAVEVTLHGITLPVAVHHPLEQVIEAAQHTAGAGGGETIAAPMPGLVVAMRVRPGQTIAPGQAVVVIEAMKMQNELSARHGGVVSEVLVAERASVSTGQPLVRIVAGPK
jgi:biotin carboxyl carrier protein